MPFQIVRIRSKGRTRKINAIKILRNSTHLSFAPDELMGLREAKDIVDALMDTYAHKPYVSPVLMFSTDLSRRASVREFEQYFEVTPTKEETTLKLFSVSAEIDRIKLGGVQTIKVAGLMLASDQETAEDRMHEDMDLKPETEELMAMEVKEFKGPFADGQILIMKEVL